MSGLYDYQIAERLVREQVPVDALIMAAARRADTANRIRLESAFPALVAETHQRFNAPGGRLPSEVEPPWACAECGSTYDACTLRLRADERPCCASCANTATHGPNQHQWAAHFGAKTVAEVRESAVAQTTKDGS